MPSSSTSTVDTTVATTEWVTKGPQPEKTRRNSARVGVNVNWGGQVSAADSGLNAVSTIHSTGRKDASPTTQARTPQPTWLDSSRSRGRRAGLVVPSTGAAVAAGAVMRLPP